MATKVDAVSVRIPITLACGDYDRTRALRTGEVTPDGVALTYLTMPPEEVFFRTLRHREFEAAEMSLGSYVMNLARGGDYVAIPVFPSRAFRHSGVYVRAGSGLTEPAHLADGTVGVPEYQMTAALWIRGIFAEHHDLPVASVRYRTGGLHEPGRTEKIPLPDHLDVDLAPAPADRTLLDMLFAGDLDAVYTARTPLPFTEGDPRIRRLFPNPRAAEERYAAATGIFPIMHTVVLRTDVYQRHRWLARSMYGAFERAKALVMAGIAETNALRYALPWLYEEAARAQELLGRDYWPYGIEANEVALRTLLRYAHEQGLADRRYEPHDLFAAETFEAFRV